MIWSYVFWVLAALATVGLVVDFIALRRGIATVFARASAGVKTLVALSFVSWWVVLSLHMFQDWQDLATFALLLVLSIPVLLGALACDAVVLWQLRDARD